MYFLLISLKFPKFLSFLIFSHLLHPYFLLPLYILPLFPVLFRPPYLPAPSPPFLYLLYPLAFRTCFLVSHTLLFPLFFAFCHLSSPLFISFLSLLFLSFFLSFSYHIFFFSAHFFFFMMIFSPSLHLPHQRNSL